jgi:tetratricopeptide (TPR) repeat protein
VAERTALRTLLERGSRGERGVAVVLGEPGIGKTTLLRDLAQAAGWRGWQSYWGEAHEHFPAAPFAPLTTALEKALPPVRAHQLVAALPPVWLTLLARLFPTLAQAARRAPEHETYLPRVTFDAGQVPQALAQLLAALQAIAPLLLLLDDVQWGDQGLWSMLNQLLPLIKQQRVVLVLSARRDDLRNREPVWQQVTEWDRTGLAQIIALDGLPPAELGELTAWYPATAQAQVTQALHTASGGNPLLALEILAAKSTDQVLTNRPAIASLIKQRLYQLDYPARQAAELAAILGTQVDYHHWEALWQLENPYAGVLAPQAATLEQAGLLRVEGEYYLFAHGLLHSAALSEMSEADRQRRHATVLTLLTASAGAEEALTTAELLRLLHHAQEAKALSPTIHYALLAGQRAVQAFSFSAAETHFTLALTQLATLAADEHPDATVSPSVVQRYTALIGRCEARHLLADRNGEAADLATLRSLPLNDEQQVAIAQRLAHYQLVTGDLVHAQSTITAALAQASALALPTVADLAVLAGRIARDRNELAQAYRYLATAQAHYEQANNPWGVALTTDLLGGIAWDGGDYEQAATRHAQAADVFATLGDLVREAQSLNNLGSTLWELGRYVEARTVHERSILVCRELGNKLSEGDNIDNLGGVAWVIGDYALALRHYGAALHLREAIDDQWGISISLSNLGSTHQRLGQYEQALDYYERSLTLSQQVGRKRSAAYIIYHQGQTRLALGQPTKAWALLQEALVLRSEVGDRLRVIETHCALLQAALALGDAAEALRQRTTILTLLQPTDRAALRQEAYFAAFLVADHQKEPDAARFLALALTAQNELADALPPAERNRFWQAVPLNQAINTAVARYRQTQLVTLAGPSAPITLTWTVTHPADSLIADSAARRRAVLARLLAEAAAHQATPTHNQLAQALGVSRRTILRDLPLLGAVGD